MFRKAFGTTILVSNENLEMNRTRNRKISVWGQMDRGVHGPLEKPTQWHELCATPGDAWPTCLAAGAAHYSLRESK